MSGLSEYERYLRSMAYASGTVGMRLRLLRLLPDPLTATRDDILAVVSRPASSRSRACYLAQLRGAYRDFRFLGWRDDDPTAGLRVASSPAPPPRPYSDAEVSVLLGLPEPVRSWAVVGCYAGLRAAECCAVTRESLTPAGLRVVGKGGKEATVPAHPLVVEVVSAWQPVGLPSGEMSRRFRWAAELAGVAAPANYHRCRHTYATRLLAATGDLMLVRDAMRHTSVATTQRYVQVADSRVADAIRRLAA